MRILCTFVAAVMGLPVGGFICGWLHWASIEVTNSPKEAELVHSNDFAMYGYILFGYVIGAIVGGRIGYWLSGKSVNRKR